MIGNKALFWSKVDRGDPLGCWLWRGARDKPPNLPYGRWHPLADVTLKAHRVAYELLAGPIPDGLTLDHLCRNPPCANPLHLEPVTNRVNTLRGNGPTAVNARKTHCKRGHLFEEGNTGETKDGRRYCKACHYAANRARRESDPDAHRAYQRKWARKKRAQA